MFKNIVILLLMVLQCHYAATGFGQSISLSGADWRIHEDADGKGAERRLFEADASSPDWIVATVPGTIQADLEAAHQLNPLWYGAGDPLMHEVARKDWWYRKDFSLPATLKDRRLTLVFDGVDYECEVWVNGKRIGANAGMFRRFQFDVTEVARPGEVNRLAVRIGRIPEALVKLVLDSDAPGGSKVGNLHAIRQYLKELKSPTNQAWDWAVAVYTLGIWKDVRLEATGPARIDWTRVQTALNGDFTKATVTASLEIDSAADLPARALFRIAPAGDRDSAAPVASATVDVVLKKGANEVKAELPVDNPALWWPNGQGSQPLYVLRAELAGAEGAMLDVRATRFGIREIRWEQCPGAPADFINPLKLVVNGRPVRQMGSNLVPPDILFGRMDQRGPALMEQAKFAGINCLRLWGGGVTLSAAMYDRADELGIMLIQEFILANCLPETDAVFLANLEATAINTVKQVRNHPSIVEWNGGNEMLWKNGTVHPALQLLEKIVREEDGRIFRATEAAQGSGHHGTFTYVYHTEPEPQLSWLGAGRRNLYQRYNDSADIMRLSEFGCNSPANLEVWHREIPPASQWPLTNYEDPVLIRKNVFHGALLKENWLHKELTERIFGPLDRLEDLVPAGQFLGAEGLRYAMDALRRNGPALGGGFMSWNYNEPWPNGAGSYMVDYDGRPLMNYDFVKQALAPVSLGLKYDSLLYDPAKGVSAELVLVSDAPARVENLNWNWIARDRRGEIFGSGKGTAAINPIEAKLLATLALQPPMKTAFGPIFVELRLTDAAGKLLAERLHVFGADGIESPLAGLLRNTGEDRDDERPEPPVGKPSDPPDGAGNLAFVGNGAKPATASSSLYLPIHQPAGINDGRYGNDHSWIGAEPGAWFQIDLGKTATVGLFKSGRDRTGKLADRTTDSLKIESSLDAQSWQTLFEKAGLKSTITKTLHIHVAPVQARYIRVTPTHLACIDEFEVYAPAADAPKTLPAIISIEIPVEKRLSGRWRPVRRTTLAVEALPPNSESEMEILELMVRNTGSMTAFFCEPHPLISYRTDLFIENNNCFIPPGESRLITIRADRNAECGLTLAQTGWRISSWNADDLTVMPSGNVLLSVGRRDQMCREFVGYFRVISRRTEISLSKRRALKERIPMHPSYSIWPTTRIRCGSSLRSARHRLSVVPGYGYTRLTNRRTSLRRFR